MPDVLRLVRAHNLLLAALGVLAGGWIALSSVTTPRVLWFASLAAIGFGAAGNALNDIWDRAGDRVNRPRGERPLAAGRLARGTADLCVVAGALVGLAAAALVNGAAVLVGTAALAVMIAYSPLLKRLGLPGNVAVALVAGLPLLYGAIAVDRPAAGLVPWTLAAWLHLVREIVKDLRAPSRPPSCRSPSRCRRRPTMAAHTFSSRCSPSSRCSRSRAACSPGRAPATVCY